MFWVLTFLTVKLSSVKFQRSLYSPISYTHDNITKIKRLCYRVKRLSKQLRICCAYKEDVRDVNSSFQTTFFNLMSQPVQLMVFNIFLSFRGLSFSSEWGGGSWTSWGSQNFFMRYRGVTKKSRDYWVATNFNENFVQWNIAPKMYIFRATRIGGYMFLQHCSSGWGGGEHKVFDYQMGSQKYCRGTFGNSWPPLLKKMVAPLVNWLKQITLSIQVIMLCVWPGVWETNIY